MPENNSDTVLYVLIGFAAIPILFGLLAGLCTFINDFSHELKFLNIEIDRAEGAERKYWIRKRRRLWLSLIPFVRY